GNRSKCSCARLIGAILIFFLNRLHDDSNVISRSAKRAKLIALLALLPLVPVTIYPAETATGDQDEYDRILQLISNEDWKGRVRCGCFLFGEDGHLGRSSSAPALHCHLYNSGRRFNGRI